MIKQPSRIRQKRTKVAFDVPTLAPSTDHTDDTWIITDIYPGEIFYNMQDKIGYIGLTGGSGSFIYDSGYTITNITTEKFWGYDPIILNQIGDNEINLLYNPSNRFGAQYPLLANNFYRFFTITDTLLSGSTGTTYDITYMFTHPLAFDYSYTFKAMLLLYDDVNNDVLCGQYNARELGGSGLPTELCQFGWNNTTSKYYSPNTDRYTIDPANYFYGNFDVDSQFSLITTRNLDSEIYFNVEFQSGLSADTTMKFHITLMTNIIV